MAATFACTHCGRTFLKGWSDEDAAAEVEAIWGQVDDPVLVCDDCWQIIRPDRVPDAVDLREQWENARAAWEAHTGQQLLLAKTSGPDHRRCSGVVPLAG